MVENGEIALTIIEASVIALPLWLVVVRYSAEDIQLTMEDDSFSKWEGRIGIIIWGGALGIAIFSLLGAYIFAAAVAIGASKDIHMAILLLATFLVIVGMQMLVTLSTKLDVEYGKGAAVLLIIGLAIGSYLMFSIII